MDFSDVLGFGCSGVAWRKNHHPAKIMKKWQKMGSKKGGQKIPQKMTIFGRFLGDFWAMFGGGVKKPQKIGIFGENRVFGGFFFEREITIGGQKFAKKTPQNPGGDRGFFRF